MLSRTTLRTKLILLALVPLVAVFVLAGRSVRDDFAKANAAAAQAAEVQRASNINDIAGALERELLADRLIAPGVGEERNLVSPRRPRRGDRRVPRRSGVGRRSDGRGRRELPAATPCTPRRARCRRARHVRSVGRRPRRARRRSRRRGVGARHPEPRNLPHWSGRRSPGSSTGAGLRHLDLHRQRHDRGRADPRDDGGDSPGGRTPGRFVQQPAHLRRGGPGLLVAAAEASAPASRRPAGPLQFGSTEFIQLVQANGGAELTERIAGAGRRGVDPGSRRSADRRRHHRRPRLPRRPTSC